MYFIIVEGTPLFKFPLSSTKSTFSNISFEISSIFAGDTSPDIFALVVNTIPPEFSIIFNDISFLGILIPIVLPFETAFLGTFLLLIFEEPPTSSLLYNFSVLPKLVLFDH